MQEVILTTMSPTDLHQMISECIRASLKYPPIQEDKARFLTEIQAAKLLDIPIITLQALIAKSEIPVRIKGKHCYFSEADLLAWDKQKKGGSHE